MSAPPTTTAEQADLAALVAEVTGEGDLPDDTDPAGVERCRRRLAELGLWTLGVGAAAGGGGADPALVATALAGLGHRWAALGWASVQAHAAAEALAGDRTGAHTDLVAAIHAGDAPVAVVDAASPAVGLVDGRPERVDRIDAAGLPATVLVLGEEGRGWLVPAEALDAEEVRRTGLQGARTAAVRVTAPERVTALDGLDDAALRVRLRLGAAAVAAGLAGAAADAAVGYSAERSQFGAPLTALPTVRESLLASSGAAATVLRSILHPAPPSPWQATALLDAATEAAVDTCARAVQAHGGYGYLAEYPVERLLRDAVSLRAACDVATGRRSSAQDLVAVPAAARDGT
jgi:alkylation response protein AidB-like acyl-CoA dehydrogenase